MNEKPILFSGPMVRAILENRKTMTRRVIKPQPPGECKSVVVGDLARFVDKTFAHGYHGDGVTYDREIRCPYGSPGNRLWVRETWQKYQGTDYVHYRANGEQALMVWRPSIHMPRWASRLTLEITGVKVERVQDISPDDVVAEGWTEDEQWPLSKLSFSGGTPVGVMDFAGLWDSINGKRPGCSWQDNPWVWCISFKRVTI